MLTQNFKNAIAMVLQRGSIDKGLLPITAYNGTTYYLSSSAAIPANLTQTLTLSVSAAGICMGQGDTAPALTDYQLERQIEYSLTGSVLQTVLDLDANGNPYIQFDIAVTNTADTAVTVREIGYRQNLRGSTAVGGTGSNRVCLLDRTVLDTPVTVEPGGAATIRYTLKTVIV